MIAIPTPEYYLQLMYTPGVKSGVENVSIFLMIKQQLVAYDDIGEQAKALLKTAEHYLA